MSETMTTADIPAVIEDECKRLVEASYDEVRVARLESDLPGFDYYELYGQTENDLDEGDSADVFEERRIGGRLVLTLAGGRSVTLDEQETADVMWALANGTRRNRKAVRHGNNPEREARFARQQALMAKIVAAPEG